MRKTIPLQGILEEIKGICNGTKGVTYFVTDSCSQLTQNRESFFLDQLLLGYLQLFRPLLDKIFQLEAIAFQLILRCFSIGNILSHGENTYDLAREIMYGGIVPLTDNSFSCLGQVGVDTVS